MWGTDAEAFGFEIQTTQDLQNKISELSKWLAKGPLGKLHNVLVHIRRTDQTREKFATKLAQYCSESTSKSKVPKLGVVTRWSSDYDSICQALEMRPAIDSYVATVMREQRGTIVPDGTRGRGGRRGGRRARGSTCPNPTQTRYQVELIEHDKLTDEDWEFFEAIRSILKPMKKWTLKLQGKHANGWLSEVLPAFQGILARYEKVSLSYACSSTVSNYRRQPTNLRRILL